MRVCEFKCVNVCVLNGISLGHGLNPRESPPQTCLDSILSPIQYTIQVCVLYPLACVCVCVCCCAQRQRDQALIKSNKANLSNVGNEAAQRAALSASANGWLAICYADRYTGTSQENWISGNKEPLLAPPPRLAYHGKYTIQPSSLCSGLSGAPAPPHTHTRGAAAAASERMACYTF